MEKSSSAARSDLADLTAGAEGHWRMLGEANTRLMHGMLAIWQRELELGQELMTENFADPGAITEFFSGSPDGKTRWSAAHRRFDRAVQAMRRINDEFYECLFDVAAMTSGTARALPPDMNLVTPAKEARAARGP